jgi:hypothetical protein
MVLAGVGLLIAAWHMNSAWRAGLVGRWAMASFISPAAMERSQIEVRSSREGWLVIFHDANVVCGVDGPYMPGACPGGAETYRDAHACVRSLPFVSALERGTSPNHLGPEEDPCERGYPPGSPGLLPPFRFPAPVPR